MDIWGMVWLAAGALLTTVVGIAVRRVLRALSAQAERARRLDRATRRLIGFAVMHLYRHAQEGSGISETQLDMMMDMHRDSLALRDGPPGDDIVDEIVQRARELPLLDVDKAKDTQKGAKDDGKDI
jgi:hypothetical protein